MRISHHIFNRFKELEAARKIALSFSGSGFLGAYNFGVAQRLLNEKERIANKVDRVAGASAGSLVAAIIALVPESHTIILSASYSPTHTFSSLDAGIETLYATADEVHSRRFGAMTPGYYLNDQLVKIIDDFLPTDISRAQDRLHVSITKKKSWENVIISKFDSRDHLIQCLLASCYIPMYSTGYRGVPPIINEEECIDGGMTNNLPVFTDIPTITCSPFSSSADICPEDPCLRSWQFANQNFKASTENLYRGARALFPPTRAVLKEYFDMGSQDADRFIKKNMSK